ncbi:MAG TPA: hypothetical protein VK151_03050 [Fluviicola sp.]|nr:hypothetical protein [Fluviicola sp.]
MVYVVLLHAGTVVLFLLYLLVKPDNRYDRIFQIKRHANEVEMLKIVAELEEINQASYPDFRKEVLLYFSDRRITNQEDIRLETQLLNSFFLGFEKRWTPFKKADFFLKVIYLVTLLINLFYLNYLVYIYGHLANYSLNVLLLILVGTNVLLFVIHLLFALMQLGLISMILSVLTAIFPRKGSVFRAQLTLDELMKLLKPGGRNTPTDMGSFRGGSFGRAGRMINRFK